MAAAVVSGCDSFTLGKLAGEARHGAGAPLQLQVSGSETYPISADSPVVIGVWPETASLQDAYRLHADSEGTYLVYEDDLSDQGLLSDDGYLVTILYDSNGDFSEDGDQPDQEDILAVYDAASAVLVSLDDGVFTKVLTGSLTEIVVDFPSAPQDGDEPDNNDPALATAIASVEPILLSGSTFHVFLDEDWYTYTTPTAGTYRFETMPTVGEGTVDPEMVVCDIVDCSGVQVFDDDGGALGVYSAVEVPLGVQQVWIGVARSDGSTFGYYDLYIDCLAC